MGERYVAYKEITTTTTHVLIKRTQQNPSIRVSTANINTTTFWLDTITVVEVTDV